MWTVLVLAIAVAVGLLVYRLTDAGDDLHTEPSRSGDEGPGVWAGESAAPARDEGVAPREPPSSPPPGYIPVSGSSTTWHARLGGAMGLLIAVAVGAISLALSLWAIVALVGRLVAD